MKIHVTDRDGNDHEIEAQDGWTIMEIARDGGMDIVAECGGCCACATCHVYVDEAWTGKMEPAAEEEIDMLDLGFEVQENSRLCCQITMNEKLDGLKVTLAPD